MTPVSPGVGLGLSALGLVPDSWAEVKEGPLFHGVRALSTQKFDGWDSNEEGVQTLRRMCEVRRSRGDYSLAMSEGVTSWDG